MRLDGKVILVTGAGTGLGHAAALRSAREGAKLSLLDLDAAALDWSRETIQAEVAGAEILRVTGDVSHESEVRDYESGRIRGGQARGGGNDQAGRDRLRQYGVRVNAIAPGAIMTDMIKGSLTKIAGEDGWVQFGREFVSVNPMKRFGEPNDVANLVAFLLSDEASFINGVVVPIDGGQSQAY